MNHPQRKIDPESDGESAGAALTSAPLAKSRAYVDPSGSTRGGLAGHFEAVMRRFKLVMNLALVLPVYALACAIVGVALTPAFYVYGAIASWGADSAPVLKYFAMGFGAASAYMTYGFSLLVVMPVINFCLRCRLKAWRGPYYSIEAIKWFVHNGMTYVARFTFLEFVTPTPFNILFFRMMGMKIGRGTMINSTWISDPSLIELGEQVTIGGSVTLVGHYGQGGYLVLAPTKIGHRVTVGLKATIMGGAVIGDGAKILPNSVILPKTVVPAGETWGGVPATKLAMSDLRRKSASETPGVD